MRTADKRKCPIYEPNDFRVQCVACLKRLEQGTFSWPKGCEPERTKLCVRPEALAMLTDGVDLRGGKLRPWYERGS